MPRIDAKTPQPDYPLRVSSFACSLTIHCLLTALLIFVAAPSRFERPVYDELIKPREHQILFYDFRRKVPDTHPVKQVGKTPEPRGAELSRQTIVATSRHPRSSKILISVAAPKVHIEQDLPTPILVSKLDEVVNIRPPERPKPRLFVPPQRSMAQAKSPTQAPILDMQAPALPSPAILSPAPTRQVELPVIGAPLKKDPETPPPDPGSGRADLTVAALHPTESLDTPIPRGDRPGSFSKAPTQGEAASGDTSGRAGLAVPDLTLRNAGRAVVPPVATEEILYTERVRSASASTLSVPLRPSARMIPPAVDAQFKGRNVYTIVIPMEHIPAYAGDWILWFADHAAKAGETPIMRAPVPLRKTERVDQASVGDTTRERIQFSATLGKNGKLDAIMLLTNTSRASQRDLIDDLSSWEFQPATSDGVVVEVDVVLEIPFNLRRYREDPF